MRRLLVGALVAACCALPAPPAAAHVCMSPVSAPVGSLTAVPVAVTAEWSPVIEVEVEIPPGFTLLDVAEARGWTVSRSGSTLVFTDGVVPIRDCAYFTLEGTATGQGVLAFAVTTYTESGTSLEFNRVDPNDHFAAQLVYAGVPIPDASTGESPSSRRLIPIAVGAAGVLVALLVATGLSLRRARR